jgi:hypothetical protein
VQWLALRDNELAQVAGQVTVRWHVGPTGGILALLIGVLGSYASLETCRLELGPDQVLLLSPTRGPLVVKEARFRRTRRGDPSIVGTAGREGFTASKTQRDRDDDRTERPPHGVADRQP